MNRGDMQCGWDTDQFPNSLSETALALYHVLQGGGFTHGGLNFDAKVRRQSIDAVDLFHGHVGAMDLCARALLVAEKMVADGRLADAVRQRYAGWESPLGEGLLGTMSLEEAAAHALARNVDERPVSGRQEAFENLVNDFVA